MSGFDQLLGRAVLELSELAPATHHGYGPGSQNLEMVDVPLRTRPVAVDGYRDCLRHDTGYSEVLWISGVHLARRKVRDA